MEELESAAGYYVAKGFRIRDRIGTTIVVQKPFYWAWLLPIILVPAIGGVWGPLWTGAVIGFSLWLAWINRYDKRALFLDDSQRVTERRL